MRLTDSTQVKLLANGFVAVYEGTGVATLVRPENAWECSWMVEGEAFEGERRVHDCGAATVEFDNGFACEAGHSHYNYGTFEYFDEDEIEAARQGLFFLPANARQM